MTYRQCERPGTAAWCHFGRAAPGLGRVSGCAIAIRSSSFGNRGISSQEAAWQESRSFTSCRKQDYLSISVGAYPGVDAIFAFASAPITQTRPPPRHRRVRGPPHQQCTASPLLESIPTCRRLHSASRTGGRGASQADRRWRGRSRWTYLKESVPAPRQRGSLFRPRAASQRRQASGGTSRRRAA
jgi:hypothetical protein